MATASKTLEIIYHFLPILQRGNALCVMGTVAHHRKFEEIYNLGTIQRHEE